MESRLLRGGQLGAMFVSVGVALAALALMVVPTQAKAASPVLEFASPGNSFPIHFDAEGGAVTAQLADFDPIVHCSGSEGEGVITGPHTALSNYVFTGCEAQDPGGDEDGHECKSAGAGANEIKTGTIDAQLVYIDQAKHEVAMLLNPQEGVYMNFECGGESVKARGSFLSPVDPVNKLAPSFTAILRSSGASQLPSEYENANGEKRQAIPTGEKGTDPPDTTGVELTFTIEPSVPLEIKAVNTAEVEAKQRAEEAAAAAAAKKRQEDEAAAAAAAKKRQEDEAAAAAAVKKRQEDEAAAAAAVKARQEEEAKSERIRRAMLASMLKQCKKAPSKHRRTQCVKRAKKKYGSAKSS